MGGCSSVPHFIVNGSIMKFLDQVKLFLKSGDGGGGCVSFRREAYVEYGGPNGGDGGRGGNVIITAVEGLNTLIDFRYKQHFKAERGIHGQGKDMHGRKGEDTILHVPVGTQILSEDQDTVLADMLEVGQSITLLKGGDGGRGNAQFKSSTNRAPRKAEPGWPGEEMWVWLRLKVIADVGLLGMPNAGKSTFLSATTQARPKIADYPFTTLHPNLGVVGIDQSEIVIADIPGLIEGAHEGKGIGDRFLGHVERCPVLLHIIDGADYETVVERYQTIRHELDNHGELANKKEVIAINKIDALIPEIVDEITADLRAVTQSPIFPISAAARQGIDPVLRELLAVVKQDRIVDEVEQQQEQTGAWSPL